MNITINSKEFVKALQVGGAFAGKNKLLPILDCVKIKVVNNRMTIVSSDKENAISKKVDIIECDSDGNFCVNYKDIYSYVSLVKSDNIKLSIDESMVEIIHDKGSIKIPKEPTDEFPSLKIGENTTDITIPSYVLNNWIVDGTSFVATDELRPIMCTLYVYSKDGEIGCCATDAQSLYTGSIEYDCNNFEFNINRASFSAILGATKSSDDINIKIGGRNVLFSSSDVSVIAQKPEGKFVNFKSVIPSSNDITVTVNKNDLISAINRCRLGASHISSVLKLDVKGMNLDVSSEDIDFNKKSVENLIVDSTGDIEIGMKYENMVRALGIVNTEKVIIEMSSPNRPVIIKESEGEDNKLALIMPCML